MSNHRPELGQCLISQFLWSAMGVPCPQDCYKELKQVETESALSRKILVTEVVSKHSSPFLIDRGDVRRGIFSG